MGITVTVNGEARLTSAIGISWSNALNSRDICDVEFRVPILGDGAWVPQDGNELIVTDEGVRVFGGILTEPRRKKWGQTSNLMVYSCQGRDYSVIPEKRLVSAVYENQTLLEIVTHINTNFLNGEGITLDEVDTGPVITKAVFNYVYANQAFNELSEVSGLTWWIDPHKRLNFKRRDQVVAPVALVDTDQNYIDIEVTPTREKYRNKQYVRAGKDITDSRAEQFTGDGATRTFLLTFPVAEQPTLATVNGVTKTIGIRQISDATLFDWYWQSDSNEFSQKDGATALTDAEELEVTYRGFFPIIVSGQDDTEIATRAALESGTSGTYEHVEDRPNVNDGVQAAEITMGLLARHGRITARVTVWTRVPGFRAGQLVDITDADHGLDGDFLIESVSVAEFTEPDDDGNPLLMYTIVALEGEFQGGWMTFFARIDLAGRQFTIRDNEVLELVRLFPEPVGLTDAIEVVAGAPETRIGPGRSRIGYSVIG